MTQAVIEAAIVSTIQLHGDFSTANTRLNDRKPLRKGLARTVVVTYENHQDEDLTISRVRRIWTYAVDVLVPWRGQWDELMANVATETQKLVDTLAAYPKLNGAAGVVRARFMVSDTPDVVRSSKGGYRGRRHHVEVHEVVDPSRQE